MLSVLEVVVTERVTCDELKSLRMAPLPANTTRARYVTSRVVAIRLYCAHTKIDRCSEREQRQTERGEPLA